jgi:hypothetical protein
MDAHCLRELLIHFLKKTREIFWGVLCKINSNDGILCLYYFKEYLQSSCLQTAAVLSTVCIPQSLSEAANTLGECIITQVISSIVIEALFLRLISVIKIAVC